MTDETTTPALIEAVWLAFSGQALAYDSVAAEAVTPTGLAREHGCRMILTDFRNIE